MTIATNDVSVAEEIELELGSRVFSCLCAENNDQHSYIQGVSALFFLTDTSDDWSDIIWMMHDDRQYDFTLQQGLRMMVGDMNPGAALTWLQAWEKREPIDWELEEWARSYHWEEWIIEGGMDDDEH